MISRLSIKYTPFRAGKTTFCPRCGHTIKPNDLAFKGDGEGNTICVECNKAIYDNDLIAHQLELQKEVMKRDIVGLMGPALEKEIFIDVTALQCEVAEFVETMKLFPWKKKLGEPIDFDVAREELVDAHHFLNNLYIELGVLNERHLKNLYMKKFNENIKRGKRHAKNTHDKH